MLERGIQTQIRIWCGEHDIPCFRANVGRVRLDNGYYFDTGLPEGFPDLFMLFGGTVWFCEVKTLKGRQRECQKAFQEMVESRGYPYIVARSVEDVAKAMYNSGGGDPNGR